MRLAWLPRDAPLSPEGLVARGSAEAQLLERARREARDLRGLLGDGILVLLGPEDALPWADGVIYVAPHPRAPTLWTPTWLRPSLPAEWVAKALGEPTLLVDGLRLPLSEARRLGPP